MSAVTTHKSGKIRDLIRGCEGRSRDPHYLGYFKCFDAGLYYEAHDVLEELWLGTKGGDYFYYKGLIQAAGAFVHLQKGRLRPAVALFNLAAKNLKPFAPKYQDFEVGAFLEMCDGFRQKILNSHAQINPLEMVKPPQILSWLSTP